MTSAFIALGIGTLLAVGALAYVLYPIFFGAPRTVARVPIVPPVPTEDLAVAALREIEFDRATGKLSDADYAQLKERYTREALAGMRRDATGQTIARDDEIEAVIRAYRSQRPTCAVCGPRPETDAAFCSECGRYLGGACEQCGRHVEEIGARFCSACGHRLAA
jgi:Double zinc ribbon